MNWRDMPIDTINCSRAIRACDELTDVASQLLVAVNEVRSIIMEAAQVGFNYADGGDWAERLYKSQAVTKKAIDAAAAAGITTT